MSTRISTFDLEREGLPSLTYEQGLAALRKAGVESFQLRSWISLMAIRSIVRVAGSQAVLKAVWYDGWYNENRPAPDLLSESSYEDCVQILANLKTNSYEVTLWDGGLLDGQRVNVRCMFQVSMEYPPSDKDAHYLARCFQSILADRATELWHEKEALRQKEEMLTLYKTFTT